MKRLALLFPILFVAAVSQAQSYPDPALKKSYSVLALGETLKVAVAQSGIYKISYENLVSAGLVSEEIESRKLALYGNVSGMLPTFNLPGTYDDLSPLPIWLHDGGDNRFGPGDYFLFFGESPHRWVYEKEEFRYVPHHYSDSTFYFVSLRAEIEHRVVSRTAETPENPIRIEAFPEHVRYETNTVNLCNGGYTWLGESFSFSGNERSFTLNTPDPKAGESATLEVATAAISSRGTATFRITCGTTSFSIYHPEYTGSFCSDNQTARASVPLNGNTTAVRLSFNKTNSTEAGYLDYINLFYLRNLKLAGDKLLFRHPEAVGNNARFVMEASAGTRIWDITDVYHIEEIPTTAESAGKISFSSHADGTMHEYIAFSPSQCPSPRLVGKVKAQNLHELQNISYIVVSHPAFFEQAQQIARLHQERDGITAYAATTEEVYNEFSSGAKDPSAIRLFLKRVRDKSDEGKGPAALLLFGAASFDYKNLLGGVSDFVPTLESYGNDSEGAATPSEDNFGYLDDEAGTDPAAPAYPKGKLTVAVGRIPVQSVEEARNAVEKIDIYSSRSYVHDPGRPDLSGNFGNWRNEMAFVTDDSFESSMERNVLSNNHIQNNIPYIHLNKLYSDNYERENSSVTSRIPELEKAIGDMVENGCLFIGYLGHSNWNSWSDEKILTTDLIDNWKTSFTFPIMMASSCTFAYYDQANLVSGAERCVLKAHAGAIAMVATSRTATVGNIEEIHKRFAESLIDKSAGNIPTIGSAFLYAKTSTTQGGANKFLLLGDPALKVALPEHNIETLRINGKDIDPEIPDTLKALSPITIEGRIVNQAKIPLTDFNGTLMVKIYDKAVTKTTLGLYNPQSSNYNAAISYTDQNSLLFQGVTEVKDGFFSFSFIVPKDIQYNFGNGRISYYAYSENSDANGSFSGIIVGGFNENAVLDTLAPEVSLFINRNNYLEGTVGEEPYLYAEISDEYGINTTGAGIGHDMTIIIDEDLKNPITVNNYFRYNTGSYKEGTLLYPLKVEPGRHTVRLKVWNINNISASKSISFNVDGSSGFKVFDMKAVPNPVRGGYVDFYFNHNGVGGGIERCDFDIFSLQGARVSNFSYRLTDLSGYSVGPLRWNLSSNTGKRLQAGMYICHMKAFNAEGKVVKQSVKLVVVH